MNNEIIFYTIHCPSCKTLQRLLDSKHIEYRTVTDQNEMLKLGMKSAPGLMVNGKLMGFNEARKWVMEVK